MLRNLFHGAVELSIFPIISMMIFLGIFISVLVWMILIKKNHISYMSNLPLEKNTKRRKGPDG